MVFNFNSPINGVRDFQDKLFALGSKENRNDRELYVEDVAEAAELEDALLVSKNNIREEAFELIDALTDGTKEDILKESCDVIYVVLGALCRLGLDHALSPAFNRVNENNHAKITMGGYLENGKLIKPKDLPKVYLSDLVDDK